MRFKLLAAVVGVAILCASVATAAQAKKKYPTTINYLNSSLVAPPSRDTVFSGNLESAKPVCEVARLIGAFQNPGTGFKLFDLDLASFKGAWAVRGFVAPGSHVKISVSPERHRHFVCKGASVTLPSTP